MEQRTIGKIRIIFHSVRFTSEKSKKCEVLTLYEERRNWRDFVVYLQNRRLEVRFESEMHQMPVELTRNEEISVDLELKSGFETSGKLEIENG